MSVLAIDYDGTIHGVNGQEIEGARDGMRSLHGRGHILLIHTARPVEIPSVRAHVSDWLDEHLIPYDDIVHTKPEAAVYLDDRALRFVTWPQAIVDISALRFRSVTR